MPKNVKKPVQTPAKPKRTVGQIILGAVLFLILVATVGALILPMLYLGV